MKKVLLPESDVSVSQLTFGAWAIGGWLWGGADEKEAIKAIETAITNGMTTIDTAPVYGFGQSEEFVAKAIKGKRDKVEILTKFGLVWNQRTKFLHYEGTRDNNGNEVALYRQGSKENVIKECEACLKRLNTDYIDLFQQHWPDDTTPIEETMEALEILKTQGKIRSGGVSNFSKEQFKAADSFFKLSSNQVPYSMVNRNIEEELIPYCIENNKAIIVYSPLQRGLLTGKITPNYLFNEGDHRPTLPYFQEPNLSAINKFLEQIKPVADSKNATLSQLVLHWTMQKKGITVVLAGARNVDQVLENIKATELTLSEEEYQLIDSKLNKLQIKL